MENNLEKRLSDIEEKLDLIIKNQDWQRQQWKDLKSPGHTIKQWGSFYLASLLADETLGLNGSNSILGNNK